MANSVLEEEYQRSLERKRLLHHVHEHLSRSEVTDAMVNLVHVVEMLSSSEERVMRLHAECVAMLEHSAKVLARDAALTPTVTRIDAATLAPDDCVRLIADLRKLVLGSWPVPS